MNKTSFLLSLIFILLLTPTAEAGYFELGISTTYRRINLPRDNAEDAFDTSYSLTASGAYYFAEMAALELSLTKGESERFVPNSSNGDSVRTSHNYSIAGLDLIFTFAKRTDPFVPYVKVGVAYFVQKYIDYQFTTAGVTTLSRVNLDSNFVPSLGFGLKIRLTKSMAFKIGMEAWTSDSLGSNPQFDIAGKAGVSWLF